MKMLPATRFPPVGHCIYCGAADPSVKLTDEHVIAYGLGGNLILPQASCEPCAAITGSIEQYCLRKMFIEAKTHLQLPTRRLKERRQTLPVKLPAGWSQVPIGQHPFVLTMYVFDRPGILVERPPVEGAFLRYPYQWRYESPDYPEKLKALGSGVTVPHIFSPDQFSLMLGKIAHSYAMGALGAKRFEPLLPDLIRTRSAFICHFVGGCINSPPWLPNMLHRYDWRLSNDGRFYSVRTQLFAYFGAPSYEVVVGRAIP